MTHPAQIKHALTSVVLKPTFGVEILMASCSALVISVLRMVDHFNFLGTYISSMWPLVPCHRRCATSLGAALTAHAHK